jgi:hypothetical protein
MRCKLLTIIKNWETSGQGDGGMDREQDGEHDELEELDENSGMGREQEEGDNDKQQYIQAIADSNVDEIDKSVGCLEVSGRDQLEPSTVVLPS